MALWTTTSRRLRNASSEEILTRRRSGNEPQTCAQRERERLRLFESLDSASAHAVELLGGKLTLLTYDKKNLEAEDMVPASFLVFGRSSEPLTKQIGPRWFLSPGTAPRGGAMLLDDSSDPVTVTGYDAGFAVVLEGTLDVGTGARVKISE
jgi:hypothetical protein